MPLYDFKCVRCGIFEEYFPISESSTPKTPCPKCGAVSDRLFTVPHLGKKSNGTQAWGRTRTEHDNMLRQEGWGSCFKNDADREKCKYLESKGYGFPDGGQISRLGEENGKNS